MTAASPPTRPADVPAPRTPLTRLARAAKRSRLSSPPSLRLGLSLARRGFMPIVSIVICVATAVTSCVIAVMIAMRGAEAPGHDVPIVASSALAWGGGFLLAFSAAAHALRKDRAQGIRALFVARTMSLRGYLLGRIGGLALLLALLVAGGTLATGLCGTIAALASSAPGAPGPMLQSTLAGIAYGIGFAVVIAPVAFAALGARSRLGGYIFLLGLVTVPELLILVIGDALPESLADVLSIPSALGALRESLSPGTLDGLRALRAIVAIAVFAALASVLVRRDASLVAHPEPE